MTRYRITTDRFGRTFIQFECSRCNDVTLKRCSSPKTAPARAPGLAMYYAGMHLNCKPVTVMR